MPPKFLRCGNPTASPSPPSISAPTGPFALGTQVGVPTGTSLTNTSGLPAADATESLTLTHPLTGVQATRTVSVWRRRRWTTTLQPLVPAGATYLFDECEFSVPLDNACFDLLDNNGVNDLFQPLVVFRRCTFDGNDSTGRCCNAGFAWVMGCDFRKSIDGFGGGYWSVIMDSNIIGGGNSVDDHVDGFQNAGIGQSVLYHTWFSAGPGPGASQSCRFSTEFGPVTNVKIYYCGIEQIGGYAMQIRPFVAGDITNVDVEHCRWLNSGGFGPTDFAGTVGVTWVDNAYTNGTVIPPPDL